MKKPANKTKKKSAKGYKTPKLATHGDVAKLTQRHGKFKPQCPGSGFDQRD
ncbi:MAG TPA: hypothetical protein VIM11_09655 [Tepidisphaeraceae bacterium]|jgi:hypothetical protein